MRNLFALALCLVCSTGFAQKPLQLKLNSGNYDLPQNSQEYIQIGDALAAEFIGDYTYRYMQFSEVPTSAEKEQLKAAGYELLYYLPQNTFAVAVSRNAQRNVLASMGVVSVSYIRPEFRMENRLLSGEVPGWALSGDGMAMIKVQYFKTTDQSLVKNSLEQVEGTLLDAYPFSRLLFVRLPVERLPDLAALPGIAYIEPIDEPAQPEEDLNRSLHRTNVVATDYSTGRQYDGTGVIVAMGDDGIIGPHIDYEGRTDQANVSNNNGDHGDHVAGIIMGAGNLDPTTRGMAFGADLYVYSVWDAVNFTPTTYVNPGVRITSTSYGNGCNAGYTTFAQTADQQVRTMPSLMHVFSCGNSGTSNCGYGAGAGWGNITGGIKIGKNVIAVGNVNYIDGLANSSSRGPAHDGRIKPDMCAVGTSVYSTIDVNTYTFKTGTSMACPGVSGTLAQLYHAYKTLNGGTDPNSGLMKATLQNTAEDLGNPGPDYSFGYGRINGARAVRLIEDNRFLSSTVATSGSNQHNVTVPANVSQLRIMVYWTDYEAAANASVALVNDLDMVVTDPNTTTYDPWILDPTPNSANLSAPATRGVDRLNNMEQVTIDNPVAGNYTVDITGFNVPQGPQEYYVLWEFITDDIEVTYPIGGEGFVPGETETLRWDTNDDTGTFTIDYSTDNGATWSNVAASVAGADRYYDWTVPNDLTGEALVRVTRGANSDQSTVPFSIIPVPQNIQIPWSCSDSTLITWDAVPGATGYEISMLGTKYMDSIGTSATTSFLAPVPAGPERWFSVKAYGPQNAIGRRAIAVYKAAGTFNCPAPIDMGVSAILSPQGPLPTCQGSAGMDVVIEITNYGLNPQTNIPVNYQLDANPVVNETYTGTVGTGQTVSYTFTQQVTIAGVGPHTLTSWTGMSGDADASNDATANAVDVISSNLVTLPYSENFETFTACATTANCGTTVCPLTNDWVNATNGTVDDIDWRTDAGGTPSANTGPDIDNNPGTAAGNYLYTEASAGCNFQEAWAISPCFDLTSAVGPSLSFWYHMEGGDMGDLHVDVLSGGVWTNDVNAVISGDQGPNWREAIVDLTPFVGDIVNIRIRGVTGNSWQSDIAIDDVAVTDNAPPVADFSFNPAQVCTAQTVTFTDNTTGGSIWNWDFGAGASPATAVGPGPHNVTYSAAGPKNVELIVTNAYGSDTTTQSLTVGVDPVADFSWVSNLAGDTYTFTDLSVNATSWFWDFGDGNTSTQQNPVHVYANTGTYTVTLVVQNDCNADFISYVINVTIYAQPVSNFSNSSPVCVGDPVTFTDVSTGNATTWDWDFGAGASPATASTAGPHVVIYSTPGIKTVTLTITNPLGTDSYTTNITVDFIPTADFSWVVSGNGEIYDFTDLSSSNATSWSWDFGDGNTSTQQNPQHIYAADGTYNVSLIASNGCGSDTMTYSVTVLIVGTPPVAGFSNSNPVCELDPVTFTDNSTDAVSWDWDFGAGATPATANTQGPHVVTYSTSGNKTVTLIVTNPWGTDTMIQNITVTGTPNAAFTQSASGNGDVIDFTDQSSNATSWDWDFGDGSSSTQQNPSHTYATGGDYDVILVVSNACGADSVRITVNVTIVGIGENESAFEVLVWPNPTSGEITIRVSEFGNGPMQIKLMDAIGKQILMKQYPKIGSEEIIQLNLGNLPSGNYHLLLEGEKGVVLRKINIIR